MILFKELLHVHLRTADPAERRVVPNEQKNTSLSLNCSPTVSMLMFSKSEVKKNPNQSV